jgi:HD-GYP domain-containing protein (c-di-GMP phosphodiesterase class II)
LPADAARLFRRLIRHDPESAGHALRVCRYSCLLGSSLDLSGRQRRRLCLAAWLHDVGKIYVPRIILQKSTPLSADEYLRVQEHPVLGEHLIAGLIHDPEVRSAVRSHHERWNGAGYPDGLSGTRIPLLARILAVADCFDAMTSPRPYRAALARAEVRDALRAAAGTQLDPAFVRVFRAALHSRTSATLFGREPIASLDSNFPSI